MEIWCVIEEAPNYEVSSDGRVRNRSTGRVLAPNKKRYLTVNLSTDQGMITRGIHILVADAFYPGNHTGLEVNHRDTNKHNNEALNLEWITHLRNQQHASEMGLMSGRNTQRTPIRIIETGEVFESQSECARFLGGSVSNINACLHGHMARYMGYTFEFV